MRVPSNIILQGRNSFRKAVDRAGSRYFANIGAHRVRNDRIPSDSLPKRGKMAVAPRT